MLLHDLVEESAASFGDRIAIVLTEEKVTYRSLRDQISTFAKCLLGLGIRRGDRVGVYLDKRLETVIAFFGISLCGAIIVPINTRLKQAQIRHILTDCDVAALISSSAYLDRLKTVLSSCLALKHVIVTDNRQQLAWLSTPQSYWLDVVSAGESAPLVPVQIIDNDAVAIFYTSGSTGLPKGVVFSHRNMVAGARGVVDYLNMTENDVNLAVLPFSFDAGFSQLTTSFAAGASVVLLNYLVPQDVIRAVTQNQVTGITGVPPLWNQLSRLDWSSVSVEGLRYIASTGGPMPSSTLSVLREQLPQTEVFLMYGLTEAFRSTYLPPSEIDKRPQSIGKAVPNAEILVIDESGNLCGPGETGELVHRGATVALGYWNDAERTAKRFRLLPRQRNGVCIDEIAVWSGDDVVIDSDGYLYFLGRKDDMIKSSGYRISPTEVEELIYGTGLIKECAALGVPHPDVGQAVVVVMQGATPDDYAAEKVIAACRDGLPSYMIPRKIVWKSELPRNPNGKIDRRLMAVELEHLFETAR